MHACMCVCVFEYVCEREKIKNCHLFVFLIRAQNLTSVLLPNSTLPKKADSDFTYLQTSIPVTHSCDWSVGFSPDPNQLVRQNDDRRSQLLCPAMVN